MRKKKKSLKHIELVSFIMLQCGTPILAATSFLTEAQFLQQLACD